jgi:hypothetical protein
MFRITFPGLHCWRKCTCVDTLPRRDLAEFDALFVHRDDVLGYIRRRLDSMILNPSAAGGTTLAAQGGGYPVPPRTDWVSTSPLIFWERSERSVHTTGLCGSKFALTGRCFVTVNLPRPDRRP